jgi:hypothetical protein
VRARPNAAAAPLQRAAAGDTMGGLSSSRFANAYYVSNLLVIASYGLLRNWLAEPAAVEGPHARLPTYEKQAALMLLCSFGLKARSLSRCSTRFCRAQRAVHSGRAEPPCAAPVERTTPNPCLRVREPSRPLRRLCADAAGCQVMRVHSVEHMASIMFSYAKARPVPAASHARLRGKR